MGLGSFLFGGTKNKDLNIYALNSKQRTALGNDEFARQRGIAETDPHAFWGRNYQQWMGDQGLTGLQPEGGLDWNTLTGRTGGGPRYASASLIDLNAEPYQTKMRDDIRQGFVGRLRGSTGAATGGAIKRMLAQASLSGLSPAAKAQMALRARTAGADTVGQGVTGFETDAYRNALNRQAEARSTNANLGTRVSETNAQLGTGWAESQGGRDAGAARMLLGMKGEDEDRMLRRYELWNRMNMGLMSPVGSKTQVKTKGLFDYAKDIGGAASSIAGAIGAF